MKVIENKGNSPKKLMNKMYTGEVGRVLDDGLYGTRYVLRCYIGYVDLESPVNTWREAPISVWVTPVDAEIHIVSRK